MVRHGGREGTVGVHHSRTPVRYWSVGVSSACLALLEPSVSVLLCMSRFGGGVCLQVVDVR